jgi:putative transposase
MKAYRYKLKPSAKVITIFESWLALLCELYNAALQERRDAYRINHLSINYKAQANQLPEIKKDRPEFAQIRMACAKCGRKFHWRMVAWRNRTITNIR